MFKSAKSASWTFLKAKQPNDIGLLYYWLWSVSLGMTGEFEINTCKSCLWERWDKHGIENRLHDKEHVKTLFTFWRSDKICCELQSHVSCEGFWVMSCVSRLMPPLSPTIFHLAASWPGWANCCEATLLTRQVSSSCHTLVLVIKKIRIMKFNISKRFISHVSSGLSEGVIQWGKLRGECYTQVSDEVSISKYSQPRGEEGSQ